MTTKEIIQKVVHKAHSGHKGIVETDDFISGAYHLMLYFKQHRGLRVDDNTPMHEVIKALREEAMAEWNKE